MALSKKVRARIIRNANRRYYQRILKTRDPAVIAQYVKERSTFGEVFFPTTVIFPTDRHCGACSNIMTAQYCSAHR